MSDRSSRSRDKRKSQRSHKSDKHKSRSRQVQQEDKKRERVKKITPREFRASTAPPAPPRGAKSNMPAHVRDPAAVPPVTSLAEFKRRMAALPAAQGSSTLHGSEFSLRDSERELSSGHVHEHEENFPENMAEFRAMLGVNTLQEDQNSLRAAFGLMTEEFRGVKEILGSIAASVGSKRPSVPPSEAESVRSKRARTGDSGEESDFSSVSVESFVPLQREPPDPDKVWTARPSVVSYTEQYFGLEKREFADIKHWQGKFLLPTNAPKNLTVPKLDNATMKLLPAVDPIRGKHCINADKPLFTLQEKLLYVPAPILNLWQMLGDCDGNLSSSDLTVMKDCAATAIWLLGSANRYLAEMRRLSLAEVSTVDTAKDLFGMIPDEPSHLVRSDLASKAKELVAGKRALVDSLKPKYEQRPRWGRGQSGASRYGGRGRGSNSRKSRPPPRQSGGNNKFYWGAQYSRSSGQGGDGSFGKKSSK